jgi:thioredoxin-like negative regulator of GroEL
VDATENEKVAERFDVSGYPTIKLFVDGKAEEYTGARDAAAIVDHVTKRATFSLPQLASIDELADLTARGQPVLLGLFRMPISASAAFKTFKSLALELTGQSVTLAYMASYASVAAQRLKRWTGESVC